MKITLSHSTSLNFNNIKAPTLWKLTENFLSFGHKHYHVKALNGKLIALEEASKSTPFQKRILKVIVCFTIALPLTLVAFAIRATFRKQYEFSIIDPLKDDSVKKEKTKMEESSYKVDNVMASIIKAKAEGNKVGLFIGRTNAETIPEQTGWKWFSLDVATRGTDNLDRHLKMDFTFRLPKHLKGLFNKVVVDLGVIKFIREGIGYPHFNDRVLPKLHSLLAKEEASELIVESWAGYCSVILGSVPKFNPEFFSMAIPQSDGDINYKRKKISYENWQKSVGKEQADKIKEDYVKEEFTSMRSSPNYQRWSDEQIMTEAEGSFFHYILEKNDIMPEQIDRVPELLQKIKEYAQNFFNQVTLREDSQFPCREGDKASYWHMKSPK